MRADLRDPRGSCVRFARLLRTRGVRVAPDQTVRWIRSLDLMRSRRPQDLYWSGRLNLVTAPAQLETYDALFRAFWVTLEHPALDVLDGRDVRHLPHGERGDATLTNADPGDWASSRGEPREGAGSGRGLPGMEAWARVQPVESHGTETEEASGESDREAARGLYSPLEILRERDFAAFSGADVAALREMLRAGAWWEPRMASRRTRPALHGRQVDLRATLGSVARTGGEPVIVRHRRRRDVWRKWVFLCDISASMLPYSEAYLQCLHAVVARRPRTEVFLFGTRLTRVTPQLRRQQAPDVEAYMAGVRDWHGGTRLGASLEAFLRQYGHRGMAHGAVVFVLSDGLDQGEAGHVSGAMRRLRHLAYAVVWINPLKKSPRYAPLARGMAEAMPYIDEFASGHSLATLAKALSAAASCSPGSKRSPELPIGARPARGSVGPARQALLTWAGGYE
ncbi:MAG: VWA domain-containing protein [bacterium]|nr:VWA domain-containing protein [bacterium]